jgi:hypothetical protein
MHFIFKFQMAGRDKEGCQHGPVPSQLLAKLARGDDQTKKACTVSHHVAPVLVAPVLLSHIVAPPAQVPEARNDQQEGHKEGV